MKNNLCKLRNVQCSHVSLLNNPLCVPRSCAVCLGLEAVQRHPMLWRFVSVAWCYRAAMSMIRRMALCPGGLSLKRLADVCTKGMPRLDRWAWRRRVEILTDLRSGDCIDPMDSSLMITLIAAMHRAYTGQRANMRDVVLGWRLYVGL